MTPKRKKHMPTKEVNPTPKSKSGLMAPNMYAEVQKTIDAHPEIDTMDEETRGEIIDITDWRVNYSQDRPWGRKARSNNPDNPNLNSDGMTYLRPDGLFEIYDVISGVDGSATWTGYGPYAPGENGYWWPPQPVEGTVEPPDSGGDTSALEQRVAQLEQQMANAVMYEGKVGLQSDSGKVLCAELGGPKMDGVKYDLTSRTDVGPWETWTIKRHN